MEAGLLGRQTSAIEGLPDEQRTSPVRRTLLLFILFELVLIVALWLVYVRTLGNFAEQIKEEVINLKFNTSLFDIQIISLGRFFLLEVAYGAFRTSRRWPSVLSTTAATTYMIVKCAMFTFSPQRQSAGLCYTVLILPIVMAWLSTLILECRVLPQERMAKRIVNTYQRVNPNHPSAFDAESAHFASIHRWATGAANSLGVGTIYGSPEGSLIGDMESLLSASKYTLTLPTDASMDMAAILTRAENLRRNAWATLEHPAWNATSVLSHTTGPRISSINLQGFSHKVFRMDALINAPVKTIFNDLVHGFEFSPLWNSAITSARFLQKFPRDDLDIVHSVTKEVLGGLIKPRDFVMLRTWGVKGGVPYIASSSVDFPKCPPSEDYVRAEQIINAIFLQPSAGVCHLVFITCVDLKGWFPSHMTTRGVEASLATFHKALQNRAVSLHVDTNSDEPPAFRSPPSPRQRPMLDEAC